MGIRTTTLDVDQDELPYIPVVSIGKQFKGRGVVTCHKPFECFTHYIGGRTLPCLEPECGACIAERPRRYEAFVSLVWITGRKHEIVRLTRNAMMQLKSCTASVEDYRGMVVNLERKTQRNNGRVLCSPEDTWIEGVRLPAVPELEQHLLRIWRIDGIRVSDDEQAYIHSLQRHIETTIAKGAKKDGSDTGPVAKTGS